MFGIISFLIDEFGEDIADAISNLFGESAAESLESAASGPVAPPAPVTDGYTEWDGGIAGDRFDPPPAPGPYTPGT